MLIHDSVELGVACTMSESFHRYDLHVHEMYVKVIVANCY